MAARAAAIWGEMMRVAFCLLNDLGPPSTYIHVDGHRYVLVAHAADQMQVAIESAEKAEREKFGIAEREDDA